MRYGLLLFGLISFHTGFSQGKLSKQEIQLLIDSGEQYKLTDPQKTLGYANRVLDALTFEGNEEEYITALILVINSNKVLASKDETLVFATRAVQLSEQYGEPEFIVRTNYIKATVFDQYDDTDSSLVYYQKTLAAFEPGLDTFYLSTSLTNVGQIYARLGHPGKAEEYLLKGYHLSTDREWGKLFSLAPVITFYINLNDPRYLPYLDTLAMSDFYQKASPESRLAHFDAFLRLEDATDEEREKRLREVYAYSGTRNSLINQIGFGLKLFEQLYQMQKYEEGNQLLLDLEQKAIASQNAYKLSEVYKALYLNAKSRRRTAEALGYLEKQSALRDSLLSVENAEKVAELNIRFETSQKDHEIEQQKTRLVQVARDRNFLTILSGLLIALAAMAFFFFRNRVRTTRRIAAQDQIIFTQEKENLIREKEVAELTASLQTQEKERNRIARDLHDGVGSLMSGISSQVEVLRARSNAETSTTALSGLREMIKEATAELRRTSYELMPVSLLRQGLEPAIRDLCVNLLVKNGIHPTLEINADLTAFTQEQQLTLYRIIQELLNNIVRHADATHVLLQCNRFDQEFSLVIEDDGKGFNVEEKQQSGGLGLGSLKSRVSLLKGFLDIASTPGEGTTVTVNIMVDG